MQSRRPLIALGLLLTISCLPLGCGSRPSSAGHRSVSVSAVPPVAQADPTLAVRQSVLYAQAQRDCCARHFTEAADALGRLAATPGFTPAQADFCRRQQAISLRDAGQTVPAPHLGSAVSKADSPLPVTVPLTPEQADCGPRALALACDRLGVRGRGADVASLRRAAGTTGRGTTLAGLAKAAKSVGLKAAGEQVNLAALKKLSGPALAWVDGDHYLAVLSVDDDTATVHDPNHTREEEIPTAALLARSFWERISQIRSVEKLVVFTGYTT